MDRYPEIRESLGVLLVRHRRSQCQDLRDRVFALLGIVGHDEAALLSRFFPDYSLSEREVIVIALAHMTQAAIVAANEEAEDIDVHSEEIFEALRVPSKKERRELLANAQMVDYIGSESVEEIRSQLSTYEHSYPSGSSGVMGDEEFLAVANNLIFRQPPKSNCLVL